MDLIEQKSALRRDLRQARRAIAPQDRARYSARIVQHILLWLGTLDSPRTVAIYLASPPEASIDALIAPLHARGIRVAAPRDNGFAQVDGTSTCSAPAPQNWRAANGAKLATEEVDVILLPGLGFGRDGSRLGQGQGWYDRALIGSRAILVGVAFGAQVVDCVPQQAHDVAVSWIATEHGVAWAR